MGVGHTALGVSVLGTAAKGWGCPLHFSDLTFSGIFMVALRCGLHWSRITVEYGRGRSAVYIAATLSRHWEDIYVCMHG
jgi:uncharacterized membrane protein YdfJ with MMPL/SSD domain